MKCVLLINLKLLTILNSFLLNIAEHEKSFITSGPDATEYGVGLGPALFASHPAIFRYIDRLSTLLVQILGETRFKCPNI